jgi:hypothetical protein
MDEFAAYATDCRISGRMEVGERRMTDVLNAASDFHLEEARLESLEDGHLVEVADLTVGGDELCAVVASGSRGDPSRRVRTFSTRVDVDLGPYRVEGHLHATPASDPLASVVRRATWVPLTDATLHYRAGTDEVSEDVGTIIVNRTLASSFRAVVEPSILLPWETPRKPPATARGAVDLTGLLRDFGDGDPGRPT